MTTYRPRLRAHLTLEDGRLIDGLLKHKMVLDPTAAALAPRLDGSAEWPALHAALVADGHEADDVDDALRAFMLLHAVEGSGDEPAAKLDRVVNGTDRVPATVLDGARFACQGSGACCSGYSFGPLSDDDLARLAALDLATAFPHLEAPYFGTTDNGRFLRKHGEQCIFLAGDRRCGLHAAFGAEAKPHFCRLYPLDAFATIDGVRVVDRGSCATFGVSARVGLPLIDDLGRVRALFGDPALYHPVTFVDGNAWDFGLYLRFTRTAGELVTRDLGTACETMHAIGRCLDALSLTVSRCPLEPGQPDQIATRVLATAAESWYRPPQGYAGFRGVRSLVTLLRELAASTVAAIEEGRPIASAARYREFVDLLEYTADFIALYDGTAVAPPPVLGPDVEDALRLSLRQQLFGRHVLVASQAGAGLVRIGLIQLLALAGGRRQADDRPLTAADLSLGHMLATRSLHPSVAGEILVDLDHRWREVLDGIELATRLVLGPRDRLPPID